MKLSTQAFRRFFDLHAWAGVVTGLVLYVMFLAGGFTLFHEELEQWEEPLAQRLTPARTLEQQLTAGLNALGSTPTVLWFSPADAHGEPGFDWQEQGEWKAARLDSARGELVAQRERLAHFTYQLHYLWHDVTGQWLYVVAGLLSLAWLVVLVSGLLIHLKDMVRQFHQFRPQKRGRLFWADLHKVLGVMGLPFQAAFAWSGAFLVLGPLVLPLFVGPVFGGDAPRASKVALGYTLELPPAAGAPATVLSMDELRARVRALAPTLEVHAIRLINHGRANGRFEAWGFSAGAPRGREAVQLDEVTGALVERTDVHAASELRRWLMGLHFAQFGGLPVRLVFLVLTLAAGLTILSGNFIWLARRETNGRRVLSRLTVGVGAGAWVAFGALLVASRALPLSWAGRGRLEEALFGLVFVASVTWAVLARDERSLWWKLLAVAAALWALVPLLAARLSTAGLFGGGPMLPTVAGIDVLVLLIAAGLGVAATAFAPKRAHAPTAVLRAEAGDA